MASDPCDACGTDVRIGGGISGFWSSGPQGTGGMTLELTDGSEHFLCFECIGRLPDDPSTADVESLERVPPETGDETSGDGTEDAPEDGPSDGTTDADADADDG